MGLEPVCGQSDDHQRRLDVLVGAARPVICLGLPRRGAQDLGRQAGPVPGARRDHRRLRRQFREGHLSRQEQTDRTARPDDIRLGFPDESDGPRAGRLDPGAVETRRHRVHEGGTDDRRQRDVRHVDRSVHTHSVLHDSQ